MQCRLLNTTRTLAGQRLLRASILQPLTDITTLTVRQDAVEELNGSGELVFNTCTSLAKLPRDLDKCVNYNCTRKAYMGVFGFSACFYVKTIGCPAV